MTHTPASSIARRRTRNAWLLAVGLGLFYLGCNAQSPGIDHQAGEATAVTIAGFTIPVFATATEQLSYARSLAVDAEEKSAALNLIFSRFANDRQQQGEARLELAYLYLGKDFRLADERACLQALAAYEATAREFSDLPAVRAKAYWYMAWIYTDLLHDRQKGLALYSLLAEKYPEDSFSRIAPVPWLKLVFPDPDVKPYTADDETTHSWAGLALLEMVRNADRADMRMKAFEKLWAAHRHSLTTGYALKEVLRYPPATANLHRIVEEYITGNTINPQLNNDLLTGLARWASPAAAR